MKNSAPFFLNMAQRTVHYALGERLIGCGVHDPNRFRMGNLLPDAYEGGAEIRRATHFIRPIENGEMTRYCDFEAFRARFARKVSEDDLYLGYYLHLIEDALYRVFLMQKRVKANIRSAADVSFLHEDYHLLNPYIVRRYGLKREVEPIPAFEREEIRRVHPFRQEAVLEGLASDFEERRTGKTVFMTERLTDEFIDAATRPCADALTRILQARPPVESMRYCWK